MKDMSVTVRFTAEAEGELAVANRVRSRLLSARSLPVAAFGKVLTYCITHFEAVFSTFHLAHKPTSIYKTKVLKDVKLIKIK